MKMTNSQYTKLVDKTTPPSKKLSNFIRAFIVGGLICVIGEALGTLYESSGVSEQHIKLLIPVTLIAAAAFITALGLYDKLARFAGAGALIPITGFANAMASPAMEFKSEGHILGIGAKMFTIAGPVIVFGLLASVLYGFLYWLFI